MKYEIYSTYDLQLQAHFGGYERPPIPRSRLSLAEWLPGLGVAWGACHELCHVMNYVQTPVEYLATR